MSIWGSLGHRDEPIRAYTDGGHQPVWGSETELGLAVATDFNNTIRLSIADNIDDVFVPAPDARRLAALLVRAADAIERSGTKTDPATAIGAEQLCGDGVTLRWDGHEWCAVFG